MPLNNHARRGLAGALTALALTALSGCSLLPDVSMSPGLSTPEPPATSSAPGTTAPVPVVAQKQVRPPGELDTGTATHTLPAGGRTVVIDYWTDESATAWTAADTKNIQVSA